MMTLHTMGRYPQLKRIELNHSKQAMRFLKPTLTRATRPISALGRDKLASEETGYGKTQGGYPALSRVPQTLGPFTKATTNPQILPTSHNFLNRKVARPEIQNLISAELHQN